MLKIEEYIEILIKEIKDLRKVEGLVPWIIYQGMELQLCAISHKKDVIIFEGYTREQDWTKLLASYSSGMALAIQRKVPAVDKEFDLQDNLKKYLL